MQPNETFVQDPHAYGGLGSGIGPSVKAIGGSVLGWLGNKFLGATTTEQKQRESATGTAKPYPIQNLQEAFMDRPNVIKAIPVPMPVTASIQKSTYVPKKASSHGQAAVMDNPNKDKSSPELVGYFGLAKPRETQRTKFTPNQSGVATGAFARNEDLRLKDVAAEEARVNNFWADAAKQRAMETSDRQNSMIAQLDSAIRSGNKEQAVMLTNALKGVGAIQPMNYGANENQLAEARTRQTALPYIGPKAEAEIGLQNAQAGYYQGKNATERGNAMYEGYVKTLLEKMKGYGTKALSATDWKALSDLQMTNPEMYAQAMADLKRQG